MKKILPLILLVLIALVGAKTVNAAFLVLTRIGTMSTSGLVYTTWSYTGTSPDFAGTATPGAMIAVTVNAITSTTSAALDGTWRVVPNNIVSGSNSVSIASGNESLSFLLNFTLAATPTATPTVVTPTATPTSELPEAGVVAWPLVLLISGVAVFVAGRKARERIEESI